MYLKTLNENHDYILLRFEENIVCLSNRKGLEFNKK